jgi:hypothetical protein
MSLLIHLRSDGNIGVTVPPSKEGGLSHEILVPITLEGVRVLKRLLFIRESQPEATIGQFGAPTRLMIEKWLAEEKEEAQEVFTKLDIEINL